MQNIVSVTDNHITENQGLDITTKLQLFIDEIGVSKSTKKTYSKVIRLFNDYLFNVDYKEPESPKCPTKTSVNRYKDKLVQEEKSSYTINLYMTVLKRYFSWLVKEGYYPRNIAEQVRRKSTPVEYSKQTLTHKQVSRTIERSSFKTKLTKAQSNRLGRIFKEEHELTELERIKEARDYAIYITLLLTGMRSIELARADIGDIKKHGEHFILMTRPKGHDSKNHAKPLPPQVLTAIADYLMMINVKVLNEKEHPLFSSIKATHDNSKGSRLTTRSIRGIVKGHLQEVLGNEINFANISTHSLRHSFATKLYNETKDILLVQKALGHSSPTITQRYAHNSIEDVIDATINTANSFFEH